MYNLVVIINPNKFNLWQQKIGLFRQTIKKLGGEILVEKYWGLKQFVYPIVSLTKGYYISFFLNYQKVVSIKLQFFLLKNSTILRFLIQKNSLKLLPYFSFLENYIGKNPLFQFTTDAFNILPKNVLQFKSKEQRILATIIKKARFLNLIPYCSQQIKKKL